MRGDNTSASQYAFNGLLLNYKHRMSSWRGASLSTGTALLLLEIFARGFFFVRSDVSFCVTSPFLEILYHFSRLGLFGIRYIIYIQRGLLEKF